MAQIWGEVTVCQNEICPPSKQNVLWTMMFSGFTSSSAKLTRLQNPGDRTNSRSLKFQLNTSWTSSLRCLATVTSSPALRGFVGGLLGAITACVCSMGTFLAIFPLPSPAQPHSHTREALLAVGLASFLAGAFIGRRGINAQHASELAWTASGIYAVLMFLSSTASLSVAEAATVIGLISVGLLFGGMLVLKISRRFPARSEP